jgi:hypothetical protein
MVLKLKDTDAPKVERFRNKWYHLRNSEGGLLHMYGIGVAPSPVWAWCGTEAQVVAMCNSLGGGWTAVDVTYEVRSGAKRTADL